MNTVNNNEIDLIELINAIWRKKGLIFLITLIFALASAVYAFFLASETWTSKAQIIAPGTTDMGNYLDQYEQYLSIIEQGKTENSFKSQNTTVSSSAFNAASSSVFKDVSKILFARFFNAVSSYENQTQFFKLKTDNPAVISGLLKSIQIENAQKGEDIKALLVSFNAPTAQEAQANLQGFIAHANMSARLKLLKDLNTRIETKIRTLTIDEKSIQAFSDTSQKVRLKNLNKALLIAQKAGIKEYAHAGEAQNSIASSLASREAEITLTDDKLAADNFLFLLGENYLRAQIDTLTDTQTIYPERYYQVQLQIKLLGELLAQDTQNEFNTFAYQSAPNLPLEKSAPKRGLIVVLGTLLGGFLALTCVLILYSLEIRQKRISASR